tara:strand:- start:6125 stop:6619 length:495 start_codon:yes stop_codon:yes gene_type:complete
MRFVVFLCCLGLAVFTARPLWAQDPSQTLRETHGDWEVHCGIGPSGAEECFMFQAVNMQSSLERVMSAVVAKPPGEDPLLRLTVPLGVLLPNGLNLAIDQVDMGTVGYLTCFADGCMTQVDMTADVVASLKGGNQGVVTVVDTFGQPAQLPLSLTGFTAAYDSF